MFCLKGTAKALTKDNLCCLIFSVKVAGMSKCIFAQQIFGESRNNPSIPLLRTVTMWLSTASWFG